MKQEMKRKKKFRVVWVLIKIERVEIKGELRCSYRCFLESEKLRCEKIFCKRAKILLTNNFSQTVYSYFF